MNLTPSQHSISRGFFKQVGGVWCKECTGPSHEEPVWLPATEKYFYVRSKRGPNSGVFSSTCRLCEAWKFGRQYGSLNDVGKVPSSKARPFYLEAVSRVGVAELSRRTGINRKAISNVVHGKTSFVRKSNLKKVMLELISIKRKGEYLDPSSDAATRTRKLLNGYAKTCVGCGTPLSNYTDGCLPCWERRDRRNRNGHELIEAGLIAK